MIGVGSPVNPSIGSNTSSPVTGSYVHTPSPATVTVCPSALAVAPAGAFNVTFTSLAAGVEASPSTSFPKIESVALSPAVTPARLSSVAAILTISVALFSILTQTLSGCVTTRL